MSQYGLQRRDREESPPSAAPQLFITATSDAEAIDAWVREFNKPDFSVHTFKRYQRVAERFTSYLDANRLQLAQLKRDDIDAFEQDLMRVVIDSRTGRTHQMSPQSADGAMRILGNCLDWLVAAGYLRQNVLKLRRKRRRLEKSRQAREIPEALLGKLFRFARDRADGFLPERQGTRQHLMAEWDFWALQLFDALSIRRSDVTTMTIGDLSKDENGCWWVTITGKGQKTRPVAFDNWMMDGLKRWLSTLPISANSVEHLIVRRPDLPLLPNIATLPLSTTKASAVNPTNGDSLPNSATLPNSAANLSPISGSQVYRRIRVLFMLAADAFEEEGDMMGAATLRVATPHWIRHGSISALVKRVPLVYARDQGRHSSLATTSIYAHSERPEWHQAVSRARAHRLADAGAGPEST